MILGLDPYTRTCRVYIVDTHLLAHTSKFVTCITRMIHLAISRWSRCTPSLWDWKRVIIIIIVIPGWAMIVCVAYHELFQLTGVYSACGPSSHKCNVTPIADWHHLCQMHTHNNPYIAREGRLPKGAPGNKTGTFPQQSA
jgi:hypothetical protein